MRRRTVVNGTCHHDCPDSCGWQVTVTDGVAVKLGLRAVVAALISEAMIPA
jgi:hypothetical protein